MGIKDRIKSEINGIKSEWKYAKTERELFRQAEKALMPVRCDVLYIAQIVRKYGVKEEGCDFRKSLQELVAPATPLEGEVERFSQAAGRYIATVNGKGLALGSQVMMGRALRDLCFNPRYNIPELLTDKEANTMPVKNTYLGRAPHL